MVLARVPVYPAPLVIPQLLTRKLTTTIDHDTSGRIWSLFHDGRCGVSNVLVLVVGSFGTTAEDDMDVFVSTRLNDGCEALFGDTHEGMGVGGGVHGVDGDGY